MVCGSPASKMVPKTCVLTQLRIYTDKACMKLLTEQLDSRLMLYTTAMYIDKCYELATT